MVACFFRRETPFGNEIQYNYPSTLGHVVSEYTWLWVLSTKPLKWFLAFSCTFGRERPFGNERYLSKYPGSCAFRIYMVMGVYLQNPRSGCLLFPAPSGGRCPLEMKYTYPSTLGHVVSECIWLWESISQTLGVVACFSCIFRRETPFRNDLWPSHIYLDHPDFIRIPGISYILT